MSSPAQPPKGRLYSARLRAYLGFGAIFLPDARVHRLRPSASGLDAQKRRTRSGRSLCDKTASRTSGQAKQSHERPAAAGLGGWAIHVQAATTTASTCTARGAHGGGGRARDAQRPARSAVAVSDSSRRRPAHGWSGGWWAGWGAPGGGREQPASLTFCVSGPGST